MAKRDVPARAWVAAAVLAQLEEAGAPAGESVVS